jgi:hypothetical protein
MKYINLCRNKTQRNKLKTVKHTRWGKRVRNYSGGGGYIELSIMHVQVYSKAKIPLNNEQTPKQ